MSGGRNRARLRRGLVRWGIAQITQFVWQRGAVGYRENPDGMRSVVWVGFAMTAFAWGFDVLLYLWIGGDDLLRLILWHGLWISAWTGVILLNIGFLSTLDGRPCPRVGGANAVTMARLFLLPSLAFAFLREAWAPALVVYAVVALSDVADGMLARRSHGETRLGFVLDPLADVLFQVTVFGSLFLADHLSWLAMGPILARYALLLLGCLGLYFLRGRIWIKPTPFGRLTGIAVGAVTVLLLLRAIIGGEPPSLRPYETAIAALFAAGAVHVLVIGWINFQRPVEAEGSDARRWGLRIGGERSKSAGEQGGTQ